MKRWIPRLSGIVIATALLTLCIACATPDESAAGPLPPTQSPQASPTTAVLEETDAPAPLAPDFEVLDEDGNTVRLSDFRGKPVVLNFWATWCPPCKAELPDFDQAAADYGETVSFLMVNLTDGVQETIPIVQSFMESNHYTFPVYYDTESHAAITYRVSSIPTTYFINAEGSIVSQKVGMISAAELEAGIQVLLS